MKGMHATYPTYFLDIQFCFFLRLFILVRVLWRFLLRISKAADFGENGRADALSEGLLRSRPTSNRIGRHSG